MTEMKINGRTLICSILLLGVAMILVTGCSKSETAVAIQTGTVTDFEGNAYKTVAIGNQIWMAENLRSVKLNDGTSIPLVTDNNLWSNLVTPGRSYYLNDSVNYKFNCGGLYNWYTVQTNKLCPTGWHVPSDNEWDALGVSLGVDSIAGGKLKGTGTYLWYTPNAAATNSTGFNALPYGYRYFNGSFNNFRYSGSWWSTTENTANFAWYRYLTYDKGNVGRNFIGKQYGFSVRCVKN